MRKTKCICAFAVLGGYATLTVGEPQSPPAAIFMDPPSDPIHPARMSVLHIPSHGVNVNGLAYQPSGEGLHPALVIFHGLPGNEKNLDLAQAVRRAGWVAITVNYRGSWGSPGTFSFTHVLEDANAVLAWVRNPISAARLGVDTHRLAIAGHSMGGWVVAHTAAHDHALIGAILISMGDMGRMGDRPSAALVATMAENRESLAGITANGMAAELRAHSREFRTEGLADDLIDTPLLALTTNDGLAQDTDRLVRSIVSKGGRKAKVIHEDTDHCWSDHRIALESVVIRWLEEIDTPTVLN